MFRDPVLDDLVERSGRSNNDLAQAAARLAQARALVRTADADRAPQIGIGAAADRAAGANVPGGPEPRSLFQGGANLSYELDLFGRIARAGDAARLDALAREALLQSTRLLVQGEAAQTYLALRALDDERALVREAVDAYRHTLDLTRRRERAGDVGELDVVRVSAELASNESDALAIDRQRATFETALAVLVGEAASDFSLGAGVVVVDPAADPGRRPGDAADAAGRCRGRAGAPDGGTGASRHRPDGLVPVDLADRGRGLRLA